MHKFVAILWPEAELQENKFFINFTIMSEKSSMK